MLTHISAADKVYRPAASAAQPFYIWQTPTLAIESMAKVFQSM